MLPSSGRRRGIVHCLPSSGVITIMGWIFMMFQDRVMCLQPRTLLTPLPFLLRSQQPLETMNRPANSDCPLLQQRSTVGSPPSHALAMVGDARGEYYGESSGSYMVREFSSYEELDDIVQVAGQPLPNRPDGIVCVVKYTSAGRAECRATEAEYERLARDNPATIFLRCFEEYDDTPLLWGRVDVQILPTYDVYYGGNRVARIQGGGGNIAELEDVLRMYQLQNSNLDLFSEDALRRRQLQWGDGTAKDPTRTPRTTARFVPGYDWNTNRGFFDETGEKAIKSFEDVFENWVPIIDGDDDNDDNNDRKK